MRPKLFFIVFFNSILSCQIWPATFNRGWGAKLRTGTPNHILPSLLLALTTIIMPFKFSPPYALSAVSATSAEPPLATIEMSAHVDHTSAQRKIGRWDISP